MEPAQAIDEKIEHLNCSGRFILLLLGAKDCEPVPSSLHLQNEMYLLQNLFPELADEACYEPHRLGPHSEIVENEAVRMEITGLTSARDGRLELTPDGRRAAAALKSRSGITIIQKIEEFKEFLNDLTKDELLAFICFSYPSQNKSEKESAEYKDLLSKRKKLAASMHQKGKISAQKAAEIAGECLGDFLKELKIAIYEDF